MSVLGILLCGALLAQDNSSQSQRLFSIAVKTDAFSAQQIQSLTEHLAEELQFTLRHSCPEQNLLLIEYPASLAVRIPTAEAMVLDAIEQQWNQKATIYRDVSRQSVLNCSPY